MRLNVSPMGFKKHLWRLCFLPGATENKFWAHKNRRDDSYRHGLCFLNIGNDGQNITFHYHGQQKSNSNVLKNYLIKIPTLTFCLNAIASIL